MQDRKKEDGLSNKTLSAPGNIVTQSNIVGNAGTDAFCVYNNERHAVGSKIINEDGREYLCSQDGSWQVIGGEEK